MQNNSEFIINFFFQDIFRISVSISGFVVRKIAVLLPLWSDARMVSLCGSVLWECRLSSVLREVFKCPIFRTQNQMAQRNVLMDPTGSDTILYSRYEFWT